ncbi:MAG: class I SAM-dependent methyltransferase [Patescibacteria group bacterium]
MTEGIRQEINTHINLLRSHSIEPDFKSIYDFPVYNNILVEDLHLIKKLFPQGSNILDFGCGRGTISYLLSNSGYNVTGIDIGYEDLGSEFTSYVFSKEKQKPLWDITAKASKKNINFEFYAGLDMTLEDNSFDAVVAYAVLEHVADLSLTLNELHRVLKPGGPLFISRTPNKLSLLENMAQFLGFPAHENTYSFKAMQSYLENSGFKVISIELVDFFPSNLPTKFINNFYQSFSDALMKLELLVRKTPINKFSHHFRIVAQKI